MFDMPGRDSCSDWIDNLWGGGMILVLIVEAKV